MSQPMSVCAPLGGEVMIARYLCAAHHADHENCASRQTRVIASQATKVRIAWKHYAFRIAIMAVIVGLPTPVLACQGGS